MLRNITRMMSWGVQVQMVSSQTLKRPLFRISAFGIETFVENTYSSQRIYCLCRNVFRKIPTLKSQLSNLFQYKSMLSGFLGLQPVLFEVRVPVCTDFKSSLDHLFHLKYCVLLEILLPANTAETKFHT